MCGKIGVDIAHLLPISKPLGYNAEAYRDWSSRSHNGARAFTAIPLCRQCHDNVHAYSEQWLDEKLGHKGGRMYAYAYALRVLGEVVHETCKEEVGAS